MEGKPNPKILADFIINHMDEIFKELDEQVALKREKHFVVIRCVDAKNKVVGTSYGFTFHTLNSSAFKALDSEVQESLLQTKLNDEVGIIIVDPYNKIMLLNYKRDRFSPN